MKLVIVGGGGVRTPLFVRSLVRRRSGGLVTALCLHDLQRSRLEVISAMAREILREAGAPVALESTTDLDRALEGADFVITTLRAGFEEGRIQDEKIALGLGCIGQETVGPGGFAMAMRSIPAVLHVAERLDRLAPKAWIINFTNPAGILTQALHDAGFTRSVGICDSANTIARAAAAHLRVSPDRIELGVFGLNHCSFAYRVLAKGEDRLKVLLRDEAFMNSFMALFDAKLLRGIALLPNEYLYYYFHPDKALESIRGERRTRGEEVKAISDRFFSQAMDSDRPRDPRELLRLHYRLLLEREESYMSYAWEATGEGRRPEKAEEAEGEGYAGVALDFIEARNKGDAGVMVLNHASGGAIPFFAHHDVAELSFRVSADEITPIPPPSIPHRVAELLKTVKLYESLTVIACRTRSRKAARVALAANPLVRNDDQAAELLAAYARAHGGVLGEIMDGPE